jgi:hypothetical protein
MLIVVIIKAKMPTNAKSTARWLRPPLSIMNRLTASTAYDVGFAFATGCSQLGIKLTGKNALLANINGMVTKFMKALCVSIRVDLRLTAIKIELIPMPNRNTIATVPRILSGLKFVPVFMPNKKAMLINMKACTNARSVEAKILDTTITDLETDVDRSLSMKPKRRSRTTDVEL